MNILVERDIEKELRGWLFAREIIAIRGPRQSGKTTLLTKIATLFKNKVPEQRIHFISFEDDLEKEKFEKDPKGYVQYYMQGETEKHVFLLDEVQYLIEGGKKLKIVYDSFTNIKLVITGSSTLDINEIGSFLVGRVLFFDLRPFSFAEFLKAKDEKAYVYYRKHKVNLDAPKETSIIFIDTLNVLLKEYLAYGGYPRVVLEKNHEKKRFLLKNLFLTYLEKDIVKVYGIKYKKKMMDLLRNLASLNTSLLNYDDLCSVTSLHNKELKEILSILEDTYIIKLVRPFHRNLVTELRKNPKVYFVDTGLRNFITGRFDFSNEEWGKLFENYTINRFAEQKINYWRTTAKAEVDVIVSEKLPIEVKLHPKITRSLRSFITTYRPPLALIANLSYSEQQRIDNTKVLLVPLALL